ncbi:MAG TPA: SRPBCC family protein, partial [Bacteroidia bacterium]|nr:SRPBCC family protein [Bacteroidia bacterium]
GPNGFSNTFKEINVQPGGVWRFTMHGPNGVDFPNKIEYKEVVKPSRIAFRHSSDGQDETYFDVTVNFEDKGGKTQLTMTMVFTTEEERDRVVKASGAMDGNKQTMDKMEAYIRGIQGIGNPELVITRELDAPRDLVWKAWTNKEALAAWWGPVGFDIEVRQFELKPGGYFHYSMDNNQGFKMWGRFEFKEITAPEKLVFFNAFSDEAGTLQRAPFFDGKWALEIQNIVQLTENNGKTTLTIRCYPVHATAEELDVFHANRASMLDGTNGTFDKLETYLKGSK